MFESQTLVYVSLSSLVVLMVLIVLAIFSRRLRTVMGELESIRRDLTLVDEGVDDLVAKIQALGARDPVRPGSAPIPVAEPPGDEPKARSKDEAKPKPKDEAKPKPKDEAKPKPKDEAKPKSKDEAKPKPKDEAKPKSKDEAKPKPKDEPESKAAAEADGDDPRAEPDE